MVMSVPLIVNRIHTHTHAASHLPFGSDSLGEEKTEEGGEQLV